MNRAILVALLMLVCLPAPAGAAGRYGFDYPGQRDAASNAVYSQAVDAGIAWWRGQGITPCARQDLQLMMAPDPHASDGSAANGAVVECDMWIRYELVANANSWTWGPLSNLCNVVWHELAHTPPASLTHEQMDPYEPAKRAACQRFATASEIPEAPVKTYLRAPRWP